MPAAACFGPAQPRAVCSTANRPRPSRPACRTNPRTGPGVGMTETGGARRQARRRMRAREDRPRCTVEQSRQLEARRVRISVGDDRQPGSLFRQPRCLLYRVVPCPSSATPRAAAPPPRTPSATTYASPTQGGATLAVLASTSRWCPRRAARTTRSTSIRSGPCSTAAPRRPGRRAARRDARRHRRHAGRACRARCTPTRTPSFAAVVAAQAGAGTAGRAGQRSPVLPAWICHELLPRR